jgi:hypothetical protein
MRMQMLVTWIAIAFGGCVEGGAPPEEETAVEQALEPKPPCTEPLLYYYEAYGQCGSCTVNGQAAQRGYRMAFCPASGAKAMIGHVCLPWCGPE